LSARTLRVYPAHMTNTVPGMELLATYKADRGLTLLELADEVAAARPDLIDKWGRQINCRPRTVQDILRGDRSPSLNMAAKIEAATGVPVASWIPAQA
jgi:transcriptional regulator with XRE-family HTH domain